MKHLLTILLFISIASFSANAQYFYDKKAEEKESLFNFYERELNFSVFALSSPWMYKAGGSVFMHYNKEKVSPLFEVKLSMPEQYIVNGLNIEQTQMRQKEIPYTQFTLASGCGFSFHPNYIVYVKGGLLFQNSHIESQIDDGFKYNLTKQNVKMQLGGGIAYISNKQFSALAGADFESRSIYFGLGYTL